MGFKSRQTFFLVIVKVRLPPFINFHYNTMLFKYCHDEEKEWCSVSDSYVNGLTVRNYPAWMHKE